MIYEYTSQTRARVDRAIRNLNSVTINLRTLKKEDEMNDLVKRDSNERDEIEYNNRIAEQTAKEEADLQNFMQVDWDGEMLKTIGYEGMDDETANVLAYTYYRWCNNNYEVTDFCLTLLFLDIKKTIEEYVSEA